MFAAAYSFSPISQCYLNYLVTNSRLAATDPEKEIDRSEISLYFTVRITGFKGVEFIGNNPGNHPFLAASSSTGLQKTWCRTPQKHRPYLARLTDWIRRLFSSSILQIQIISLFSAQNRMLHSEYSHWNKQHIYMESFIYVNHIFNRNMIIFRGLLGCFLFFKKKIIKTTNSSLWRTIGSYLHPRAPGKKKNHCHIHYKVDLAELGILHNPFYLLSSVELLYISCWELAVDVLMSCMTRISVCPHKKNRRFQVQWLSLSWYLPKCYLKGTICPH